MECLTDDQIGSLADGAPGAAPLELAGHLASCERCQARALFGKERLPGAPRAPVRLPSLGRALAMLALVVAAMAAFFWTLAKLTGR